MTAPEPRLRDLFEAALQCPSTEGRAAYLDRACAGDPGLRARLEELLMAHREAGSFLGEAAATAPDTVDVAATGHESALTWWRDWKASKEGRSAPQTIKDAKVAVFRAVRAADPAHYVRGQYDGYRAIDGVAPDSTTETFAALRLDIENWRWSGVPFFIRTGKRLPMTQTELRLVFKHPPRLGFPEFDRVEPVISPHVRSKVDYLAETPFAETLYLDTDTRVLGDLSELFRLLERFELALAQRAHVPASPAEALWRHAVPSSFPQANGGVVLYRSSPAALGFMADWRAARSTRAAVLPWWTPSTAISGNRPEPALPRPLPVRCRVA